MDLYLIRHAIAVDPGPEQPDAERPLTEKGSRRFKEEVLGMKRLGLQFDLILHSPFRRAVQTAMLLRPLCELPPQESSLLAVAPGRAILELLSAHDGRVALVGHQPHLSLLTSWLMTGDFLASGPLPYKKGGLMWLEGSPRPGGMQLQAALPPRWLREGPD